MNLTQYLLLVLQFNLALPLLKFYILLILFFVLLLLPQLIIQTLYVLTIQIRYKLILHTIEMSNSLSSLLLFLILFLDLFFKSVQIRSIDLLSIDNLNCRINLLRNRHKTLISSLLHDFYLLVFLDLVHIFDSACDMCWNYISITWMSVQTHVLLTYRIILLWHLFNHFLLFLVLPEVLHIVVIIEVRFTNRTIKLLIAHKLILLRVVKYLLFIQFYWFSLQWIKLSVIVSFFNPFFKWYLAS